MKFSKLIKAWENGYRGEFDDRNGNIGRCTDSGIEWIPNEDELDIYFVLECKSGTLNNNSYRLLTK